MKPKTWEELFVAAEQVRGVQAVVTGQGYVSQQLSPHLAELRAELAQLANQRLGLLGRLALVRQSPSECLDLLPTPLAVLMFAIHSAVLLKPQYQRGGEWPLYLDKSAYQPPAKFVLCYNKLEITGLLEDESKVKVTFALAASCVIQQVKLDEFVQSKSGEAPVLAKPKELQELVSKSLDGDKAVGKQPVASHHDLFQRPQPFQSSQQQQQLFSTQTFVPGLSAEPSPSGELFPDHGGVKGGGEFAGDLQGGRGGSMLFGPGNPDFNSGLERRSPAQPLARPPPGHIPGARFDPYGPGADVGGDPNWDDTPMPGPGRDHKLPNPAPGKLGGWGSNFL
ncbi:hypothetical protein BASA81_003466 [Batrachochytrium salamandrivorans]|nr:hypothetical protein BASA81_003466 [Batrachochytrium salamandrivorans]